MDFCGVNVIVDNKGVVDLDEEDDGMIHLFLFSSLNLSDYIFDSTVTILLAPHHLSFELTTTHLRGLNEFALLLLRLLSGCGVVGNWGCFLGI